MILNLWVLKESGKDIRNDEVVMTLPYSEYEFQVCLFSIHSLPANGWNHTGLKRTEKKYMKKDEQFSDIWIFYNGTYSYDAGWEKWLAKKKKKDRTIVLSKKDYFNKANRRKENICEVERKKWYDSRYELLLLHPLFLLLLCVPCCFVSELHE